MAQYGANYPCFKPDNAANGIVIGKLVSANMTVQIASGELFADDAKAEDANEFVSATVAMETDDLTEQNAAILYGCAVNDDVITDNKDDAAPRGKLAYYKALQRNGVKYYQAWYFPIAKATLGNDNAQTKGSNITFSTTSTSFSIFADDNGDWRQRKIFPTPELARAWINQKLSISAVSIAAYPSAITLAPGEVSDTIEIFNAVGAVTTVISPSGTNLTIDKAANNKNIVVSAAADATAGEYTITLTDSATTPKSTTVTVTVEA